MPVAVYLRLSRDALESTSISRQEAACRSAAQARWPDEDVEVFRDVDVSGFKDVERPAYAEMVRRVPEFDGLVVYRVDRLTRRGARHLLELVEDTLRPAGCELVSATEPIDTSGAFGEVFLVLLATFARMESQRLSERISATQGHLRRGGWWYGGAPPLGYRTVEVVEEGHARKTLELDPDAAETVRSAARRLLDGESLRSIARSHEGPGPQTMQGWRKLLLNPALAGYRTHRGQVVFDGDGPVQPWEPVLDPATHRQVRELLESNGGRPAARRTLLSGLLVCDRCRFRMAGNRDRRGRPIYRCEAPGSCGSNTVGQRKADRFVLGVLDVWLHEIASRGREVLAARDVADQPTADELERLVQLRALLDDQLDRLLFDEGRRVDDPAVRRLQERVDRTLAAQDEARQALDMQKAPPPHDALGIVGDGAILDLELDQQRRCGELLIERVRVKPGRLGGADQPAAERIVVDPRQ